MPPTPAKTMPANHSTALSFRVILEPRAIPFPPPLRLRLPRSPPPPQRRDGAWPEPRTPPGAAAAGPGRPGTAPASPASSPPPAAPDNTLPPGPAPGNHTTQPRRQRNGDHTHALRRAAHHQNPHRNPPHRPPAHRRRPRKKPPPPPSPKPSHAPASPATTPKPASPGATTPSAPKAAPAGPKEPNTPTPPPAPPGPNSKPPPHPHASAPPAAAPPEPDSAPPKPEPAARPIAANPQPTRRATQRQPFRILAAGPAAWARRHRRRPSSMGAGTPRPHTRARPPPPRRTAPRHQQPRTPARGHTHMLGGSAAVGVIRSWCPPGSTATAGVGQAHSRVTSTFVPPSSRGSTTPFRSFTRSNPSSRAIASMLTSTWTSAALSRSQESARLRSKKPALPTVAFSSTRPTASTGRLCDDSADFASAPSPAASFMTGPPLADVAVSGRESSAGKALGARAPSRAR